jgi:glycerol-3-phosphate O-acyltransferase
MEKHEKETYSPYVLGEKAGFFLGRFMKGLFSRVSLEENMRESLQWMNREGTVVYAAKYRGQLDYLLYHFNFRQKGLPFPKIAFDLNMFLFLPLTHLFRVLFSQLSSLLRSGRLPDPYPSGFYRKAVQEGTTSLVFLIDPKGFIRRFVHAQEDRLQCLLEAQGAMDRPIFIVPQLVLYRKTPEKDYSNLMDIFFGYRDNPGFLRKTLLFFRYHRQAFIDFGEPVNLQTYLKNQPAERLLPDLAAEIRQMLIVSIDRQKRVILGPILKSRQQFKEIVLMDERVSQRITIMGSRDEKRLKQTRKKADQYFEEIAADYNMAYINLGHIVLTWFWKKMFEGIEVDTAGLAKVREWARRGPQIYIPSHKSHIDYLVLNFVLYNNHMQLPRIAAGRNLAFWPMGHIFRNLGAFFIRRSFRFRGAKLYAEIFNRYIKALIEEGHAIEFFIEGGRSRNGKLVLPKTGFLSILLQAHQEQFCEDLIFVPTSIVYDRIMEEKSYLKEVGGESKQAENFWQMIRARGLLRKRYGKIYIQFGHPVSLNDYLAGAGGLNKATQRGLAYEMVRSINAVTIVTPLSIMATAVLANHRGGFRLPELLATCETFMSFLKRYEVPMASTLLESPEVFHDTLSMLVNWKIVDVLEDDGQQDGSFYHVDNDRKMKLEYYKNNIVHFFISHAFAATSFLTGPDEVKREESVISDYVFMKHLFRNEFVFNETEDEAERVSLLAQYFVDASYLTPEKDRGGYKITKLGFDTLPLWANLAKTFLESYWIAARCLTQEGKKEVKGEADLLKSMDELGKRLHQLNVIEHVESLSQVNFKNALSFFKENVLNPRENSQGPEGLGKRISDLSERLYRLSHYST